MQIIYQFYNGNYVPSNWQSLHTFTLKKCTIMQWNKRRFALLWLTVYEQCV